MYRIVLLLALGLTAMSQAQPPRGPFQPPPGPIIIPGSNTSPAVPIQAVPGRAAKQDVVLRWCAVTLNAIKAERTPPPIAARNLAMVHVAMYDAVCAVERTHRPFHVDMRAPAGTSLEGAAAAAAYFTLVSLYPRQSRAFDEAILASVMALPAGQGTAADLAVGESIAKNVRAWRDGDLSLPKSSYVVSEALGHWRPTPPEYRAPLLPQWAKAPLFAASGADAVHPPEPPALDSKEFATAFHEVKELGAKKSKARTPDQTQIAVFWADGEGTVTPPGHWNQIASGVATARRLTMVENARLFAMLNVALADAAIACWDCKFKCDFWRPVTAIRQAAHVKNAALTADLDWEPLLATPPFPAYTSGHSSFSGAAAAVLTAFFGADKVAFSTTSDVLPGVTRSFESFTAAASEAGMSRIYGGIHWAFDNRAGLDGGKKVGEHVSNKFFKRAN